MKRMFVCSLMLILPIPVFAQGLAESPGSAKPPTPIASVPTTPGCCKGPECDSCGPSVDCWNTCCCDCGPRCWVGAEYLIWWIKNQPVPVPLATVNNTGNQPILGVFGTSLLFGNQSVNLGTFSNVRLTAGTWIDPERTVGVEVSAFVLENKSSTFSVRSDAAGNPFLGIPLINAATGANNFINASDPTFGGAGAIIVTNSSRLWGSDVNGLWNLGRGPNGSVSLLGGFRYVDLQESLALENPFVFPSGIRNPFSDIFQTRNQFYGGQLGARAEYWSGRVFASATGKVALGTNHEEVNINGNALTISPSGSLISATPGGALTAPSNIGRSLHNQLGVIPQLTLKLGYALTPRLLATVGYDILYWNQVVRPGDQIDPLFGTAPNGLVHPVPLFNKTDFWAQGVSFGLEFRF